LPAFSNVFSITTFYILTEICWFHSSAAWVLCMVVPAYSATQFLIQSSTCCVWTICHPAHSAATNPYILHSLRQWPMLIKFYPSGIWRQEMHPGPYDMLQFNGNRHGQTWCVSTVSMNVYCQRYLARNNWIHTAVLSHHTAYWQREICIAGIAPALAWHFSFKRPTTWKWNILGLMLATQTCFAVSVHQIIL
jgi:hypothetical protein